MSAQFIIILININLHCCRRKTG